MSEEIDVYRQLQKHLDELAVGFPETSSGVEISVLRHLFTPKEAKIASRLGKVPEPVKKIYGRTKKIVSSKQKLEDLLENMDKKGAIFGKKKGKRTYYRNQILAVGMYEYQVKRVSKEFMEDMVQYMDEAYAEELTKTNIYQSRIIPVEKMLTYNNFIYSYDNVRKLIKKSNREIAVADCICRIGYDRMGRRCKQTNLRESCLVFRGPSKYYVNHGFAKNITKEEALEIINKADQEGLVLQAGNSKRTNFICTCCKCCCGALQAAKKLSRPVDLYRSNYFVEFNKDLCIDCKTCINRCQMDAISIINSQIVINYDLCIGCGLCVSTCPNGALKLCKNKRKYKPPRGPYLLFLKILKSRRGRLEVIKTTFYAIWKTGLYYIIKK